MPKSDLDLEMVFLSKCHWRDTVKKHSPGQDAGASLSFLPPFFQNNRGGSRVHSFLKKTCKLKDVRDPGSVLSVTFTLAWGACCIPRPQPGWAGVLLPRAAALLGKEVKVHQASEGK